MTKLNRRRWLRVATTIEGLVFAISLFVFTTGTAAAHSGGMHDGSMMGGWGWGLGGVMGLWGFLWMALLIAVPVFLVYLLLNRTSADAEDRPLSLLRERYARGEISDEEFERQRERLERT